MPGSAMNPALITPILPAGNHPTGRIDQGVLNSSLHNTAHRSCCRTAGQLVIANYARSIQEQVCLTCVVQNLVNIPILLDKYYQIGQNYFTHNTRFCQGFAQLNGWQTLF
jgi:hypothetical protein